VSFWKRKWLIAGMTDNLGLRFIAKTHDCLVHRRRVGVLAHHLSTYLKPGSRILDVGCGDGELARILGTLVPGLEIRGVETLVRENCSIPCERYDGLHFPYPNDSFDLCLMVDILHHASDPLALVTDACRISREYVLIKDHLAESAFDRWTLHFMDLIGSRPHGVQIPNRYFSRAEWQDLFDRAGAKPLVTDKEMALYPFPFTAIFGRNLHFIALLESNPQNISPAEYARACLATTQPVSSSADLQ
jgi:SAM-dependent methyltransferase